MTGFLSLRKVALAYLVMPLVIMLLNWYTPWVSWPVVVGIIYAFWRFPAAPSEPLPRKVWWVLLAVVMAWVLLSGLGGYMYQNTDHWWRNSVLRDLTQQPWPVLYSSPEMGDSMLCYYFAYWLPAALVGKCAGLDWAQHALYAWSVLGVMIFALLAAEIRPKQAIFLLIFLIFFSGVDLIPFVCRKPDALGFSAHMTWYCPYRYSSLMSCLFYVFNQALPAWIATLLVLSSRYTLSHKTFITAVLFCFAPFPFIGLAAYVAADYISHFFIRTRNGNFNFRGRVERLFRSGEWWFFLISLSIVYLIATFFSCTGRGLSLYILDGFLLSDYIIFCLSEFLLPCILMLAYRYHVRRVLIVCTALLILPLVQIVSSSDFVMRVSVPFILLLAITFYSFVTSMWQCRWLRIMCILYLVVASAGPIMQVARTVRETCVAYQGPRYIEDLTEHANFSSWKYKESRYYKWLMKR
ncbi:MAG: hypothetical protein ACI4OX_10175 [Akkermansia sp.]